MNFSLITPLVKCVALHALGAPATVSTLTFINRVVQTPFALVRLERLSARWGPGCDQNGQTGSHTKGVKKTGSSAWCTCVQTPELMNNIGRGEFVEVVVMRDVQQFICQLYSPGTSFTQVKSLRYDTFMAGEKSQMALPPTHGSLLQHVKRAHWVAHVWCNSLVAQPTTLSPEECGWDLAPCTCDNGDDPCLGTCRRHYVPVMTRHPTFPKDVDVLAKCNCSALGPDHTRCCTGTCKCKKANGGEGLACTTMCGHCKGQDCSHSNRMRADAAKVTATTAAATATATDPDTDSDAATADGATEVASTHSASASDTGHQPPSPPPNSSKRSRTRGPPVRESSTSMGQRDRTGVDGKRSRRTPVSSSDSDSGVANTSNSAGPAITAITRHNGDNCGRRTSR